MAETAVRVHQLRRVYRNRRSRAETVALDGVDLTIAAGEIHGLLGPNGAGKTTLVKILSTVLLPTEGSAELLGHDVVTATARVRAVCGVVLGGERGLYTRVSARQNLEFWSALYHLNRRTSRHRCAELLERVGLADRADEPVERFSRGMKQRLHLARGLLHEPMVLLLDEPTSGMDPVAARQFRSLVREQRAEGRTILLTTHDMAEAEALCDRVSLIDHGRLMLSEPVSDVGAYLGVRECVEFATADETVARELAKLSSVDAVREQDTPGTWRAFPVADHHTADVLVWLIQRGVLSARRTEPSLEDVYVRLVGQRGLVV